MRGSNLFSVRSLDNETEGSISTLWETRGQISRDVETVCAIPRQWQVRAQNGRGAAHPGLVLKAGMNDVAHKTVNHNAEIYVDGDVTTNGIESAFSLLKRGIV